MHSPYCWEDRREHSPNSMMTTMNYPSSTAQQSPSCQQSCCCAVPISVPLPGWWQPSLRRSALQNADFYPAISLLGSLGWAGSSLGGGTSTTFAAGPALKWNIFDYGRIENNIRLQDARLQQLIEQYQEAVLSAAQEVDDAAISVVKSEEQLKLLEQTVKSAERALEIANTSYHEGYADFQRVLDAQRALFTQNDRLVSNISAIIALYKSLGGGWSPVKTEHLLPADMSDTLKQRVDWGDLLDAPLPQHPFSTTPETTPQKMP